MHLIGDMNGDLIVETWRRAQARRCVVGPEDSDEALLGRARRRRVYTIASNGLRFVVSIGVLLSVHRRWRRNAKLVAGLQNERPAFAPMSTERDRLLADRILAPESGLVA